MELIDFINPDIWVEAIIKSDWFNLLSDKEQKDYLDDLHNNFCKLDVMIQDKYPGRIDEYEYNVKRLKRFLKDSEKTLIMKGVGKYLDKEDVDALLSELLV